MATVTRIDPISFIPQQYTEGDKTTIPSFGVNSTFSSNGGQVESSIYDLDNNLIVYNLQSKYSSIQTGAGGKTDNSDAVLIYPEEELEGIGLSQGSYNIIYNFINNELESSFSQRFRIKEISANRKELRLTTSFLNEEELELKVNEFYPPNNPSPTYPDFYLNFGGGNLFIANNILFDGTQNQYSVLIKLYKPLPSFIEVDNGQNPWICTLQRETVGFNVEFEPQIFTVKNTIDLKGPNFSIDFNNQVHTSTKLTSFDDLNNSANLDSSSYSSSYYQLQNILDSKGIDVNIDYADFSNFIHFSSAEERVKNFYYKVGLIESFSLQLPSENSYDPEDNVVKQKITKIISNFDGFEYWMYYNSSSDSSLTTSFPTPYPKDSLNGLPPFKFYPTSSTTAVDWYENAIYSASEYDRENQDALLNTIPSYILEDNVNDSYFTFVKMIGQHFDTLFTYAQDITNRYSGDNRLDFGISKDLVGEAIKSMGVNLYTGNFTGANLISSLIGINSGSGGVDFLPPSEDGARSTSIDNYITASDFPTPIEDINKQIYKRIYHNLPLLLKQKGSIAGVRTLINCFGIPKEILDVREFKIDYSATTQSLASPEESSSISFTTESVSLPPSFDGYIPSELLSPTVRVQQNLLVDETYNRDLHYTEIGYSPSNYFDEYIQVDGFNPLENFPSFNTFYFGENPHSYEENFAGGEVNAQQTITQNISAFIRYIKFFDTSLFQMLKDFVPVRNSTATGVIIKPTKRERPRSRPAQLTYYNRTYSASANTEYYNWDGSSFVYRAIGDLASKTKTFSPVGGTGGALENLNRYSFHSGGIDTDWKGEDLALISTGNIQYASESVYTIMGYAQQSQSISNANHFKYYSSQEEFYNGEFPQTGQRSVPYLTREYRETGSETGLFTYDNNPQNPYKKPVDQVVAGLSFGYSTASAQSAANADKDIIFQKSNIINNYGVFYIKIGVGDPVLTEDLLGEQLAGSLFFSSSTDSYQFAIANDPTVTNLFSGPRYAFQAYSTPNTSFSDFAAETELDIILPFNPNSASIKPGPWAYNDFNPLINNSFDPQAGFVNYNGIRKSTKFMDVDYSPSSPDAGVPINVGKIADGTADRAPVQDSYYASRWWNNSRYLGVRRSSIDFNSSITKDSSLKGIYNSGSLGVDVDNSSSTSTGPNPYISGQLGAADPPVASDFSGG